MRPQLFPPYLYDAGVPLPCCMHQRRAAILVSGIGVSALEQAPLYPFPVPFFTRCAEPHEVFLVKPKRGTATAAMRVCTRLEGSNEEATLCLLLMGN